MKNETGQYKITYSVYMNRSLKTVVFKENLTEALILAKQLEELPHVSSVRVELPHGLAAQVEQKEIAMNMEEFLKKCKKKGYAANYSLFWWAHGYEINDPTVSEFLYSLWIQERHREAEEFIVKGAEYPKHFMKYLKLYSAKARLELDNKNMRAALEAAYEQLCKLESASAVYTGMEKAGEYPDAKEKARRALGY